jgi:dolichyl-diphosphooligosaccharide---protein glycosyltransferase
MPSQRKKQLLQATRKRQQRGRIYLVAIIIIITTVGIGWYVYASSQSPAQPNALPNVVYAKLGTSQGTIEVELYYNATPKTVANFVSLAESGFYNDLVWHRIIKGFVIQTGDPNSKNALNNATWGSGGSSQTVPLELASSLHNYAGYVAMAHLPNEVNSGTSQFFINLNDTNAAALDGQYTVFGKVISGMNVAYNIANLQVYPGTASYPSDQPVDPSAALLTNVSISNNP